MISELIPTTELEAVNAILQVAGTSPVESLTEPVRADVEMVLNMIKSTSRGIQSTGWHCNTVRAELLERDDDNEIPVPDDALGIRKTVMESQRTFDISHRHGALWNNLLNEPDFSGVEYEDGVYMDVIHCLNFEDMPECLRQYIFIAAGRRYQEQAFGNADLSNFTKVDEELARANCTKLEGLIEDPDANKSLKDQRRANEVWDSVSLIVQSQGWHFNTRKQVVLTPEVGGEILLPANTLRVLKSNITSQIGINASHHGLSLYDVQNDTALWDEDTLPNGTLKVDLVVLIARANLPQIAKNYIDIKTARQLQGSKMPSPNGQVTGYTERDEFLALRDLQDAEGLIEDYSLFSDAAVGRVLHGRSSPYGSGSFDPTITRQ